MRNKSIQLVSITKFANTLLGHHDIQEIFLQDFPFANTQVGLKLIEYFTILLSSVDNK